MEETVLESAEDKKIYRMYGKPLIDRIVALIGIVVAMPIIIMFVMIVKITSKGPAIYKQERIGIKGKLFTLYKIRSMRLDSEVMTGPIWSLPGDKRITKIGSILRMTHIDELPQLVNVLRGEISLVGPRPERPCIASKINLSLPEFAARLKVKPGLTGLAQVQLDPDVDLESVRKKLEYDLTYIENITLSLDLRIILSTPLYIFGCPPKLIAFALQLPNSSPRESKSVPSRMSTTAINSLERSTSVSTEM